ncbi:proteasome assembly chaperone family protein [Halobacterium bonnevillei]|uniref:Proteasome assembly chaperone family protein n=1 Tax=Halobacterium bonnevillei TaxID=2692200 RepID=A0A6B0ST93_9EURY|nr:PAC2 family protein [Halobacterium bonnevillei]MXR20799.1 proteasome assembly chaperone family protein [Halobacterium bonnevillei]
MTKNSPARYEKARELTADSPTLIEGLPGLGLVASIAVDQITNQLGLAQHGTIISEDVPSVAAFDEGRVRDSIRVYAGEDPDVMTLQSDVPIPPNAVDSLSQSVMNDVAEEFERAVFLAGAPANSEAAVGEVFGVATNDDLEDALTEAGISLAEGSGVIGGVTGALVEDCYHNDVPAAVLVVRSNPYMPDPKAARMVIEEALEPLVNFDIDTEELREQAEQIQQQKRQIAEQLQQFQQQQSQDQQPQTPGMYQ